MKKITSIVLFLIFNTAQAETIELNGEAYELEEKQNILKCSKFSIVTISTSLPYSVRENSIPYEKTMKHIGNPHLINEKLLYIQNGKKIELPNFKSMLSNYNKISMKRSYTTKPLKCLNHNSVLFRLWGGGNCKTVCEAYVKASFSEMVVSLLFLV